MATQIQFRRGTTAQHTTFTGAVGEITVDTDKKAVVVHDGVTAGGFPTQAADATLASIADLGTAADKIAYTTGVDIWAETPLTSFARTILDDVDAAAVRTTIGVTSGNEINSGTITPSADADVTLDATQNTYDRLILVDGSWTSGHSIIVDTTERRFYVDNSSGTYTATVKTSAGTGIDVAAGTSRPLVCDGTNVIDPATALYTEFASSTENAAGTIEGKAVDPLGIREAFNATGSAPVYACRAWVNFNGTGTVAIRASGNVSSITDNGTGNYTVNFTTAMPDANYSTVLGQGSAGFRGFARLVDANITTSSVRIIFTDVNGGEVDEAVMTAAIFD